MTNENLIRMAMLTDISKGHILIPGKAVLCRMSNRELFNEGKEQKEWYYHYIILLDDDTKVGVILNHGDIDLHWTIFPEYRGKHYLSDFLRTKIIQKVWCDISSITWARTGEASYEMTEYLAEIGGFEITTESSCFIHY